MVLNFIYRYLRACEKWKFSMTRGQPEDVPGSSSANKKYDLKGIV
jgi:hypothetical protein